jgi:uncharacterized membrane-anchored protein
VSNLKECPNCGRENEALLTCHLEGHVYCFWCAETIALFLDECPVCAKDAWRNTEEDHGGKDDDEDDESKEDPDDELADDGDSGGSSGSWGGGSYSSSENSEDSSSYSGEWNRVESTSASVNEVPVPSKSNDDRKSFALGLSLFTLGISMMILLGVQDFPETFSFMPAGSEAVITSFMTLMVCVSVLCMLLFRSTRKVFGIVILILLGVIAILAALFLVVIPSYRFGAVTTGKGPDDTQLSLIRVGISIACVGLIVPPLVEVFILKEHLSTSLVEQVLFISGCVVFAYMYFRMIRSYIKRKEPGKWHY